MFNKMMTGVVCIGLFLTAMLVTTYSVGAELRFVRPSVEVPVRRGQGTDYKIIRLVKDGDQVELLEVTDAWARVRVKDGAEGWMPKRFLSSEAPPVKLVQILRTENEQLKQQNTDLNQELTGLKDLQSDTGGELSTCIAQRDTIEAQYKILQSDTADVVAIKNKMTATQQEIEKVRTTLAAVQQQNNELKRKTSITWFLVGGGVLLLGWIIGVFSGKSRKKRSSLL
jgi:SH3 domain protein